MNYIKQLQLDAQEKQARIDELEERISYLRAYVNLPKFHTEGDLLEGYVHIKDILLRLRD